MSGQWLCGQWCQRESSLLLDGGAPVWGLQECWTRNVHVFLCSASVASTCRVSCCLHAASASCGHLTQPRSKCFAPRSCSKCSCRGSGRTNHFQFARTSGGRLGVWRCLVMCILWQASAVVTPGRTYMYKKHFCQTACYDVVEGELVMHTLHTVVYMCAVVDWSIN